MLIEFTRDAALRAGLLMCKHCKLPPNNHFGNGKRGGKCAHQKCPGYEETARGGKLISTTASFIKSK